MSNRIYLWRDKTSKDNEYASIISFTSSESMLDVRFGDFARYLSVYDHVPLYEEFLSSDEAFSIIVRILHSLQRDNERTFFTADVGSRSYLKLMSFLENVAFKNASFPKEKRLEILDLVYEGLDDSVVKNLSYYKGAVFQKVYDTLIEVMSSVAPNSVEEVRQSVGTLDKSVIIPEILLSDLFFDMTMLMAWLVNHTKHIRKEHVYKIVMLSDVEQTMQTILGIVQKNRNVDFGGELLLEKTSDKEIEKAVSAFLSIISELLHSVLNRDEYGVGELNPQSITKEDILLSEVWKTFQKDGSIWMTGPKTNKKLMKYINK